VATNSQMIEELLEVLSYMWSVLKLYKEDQQKPRQNILSGGRVEYLHCSPASHRKWQKGRSQIWDSKIWWVPWHLDLRMTALAWASSKLPNQTD
jgi:hypothetical protein